MWKYSSCKCNVEWPPIKGMCSWLLGGEQSAKKKARVETDTGGRERTENMDGGFQHAYCCSCCVGGRSCSACRQASAWGTGSLAAQLRLQCHLAGRQNLASLPGSNWWIVVAWISTEFSRVCGRRKKGLPPNSWPQQELWPKAPSLSQEQDIADPWRDDVLQA